MYSHREENRFTTDLSVHLYYAGMVNLNTLFRKTLSISINGSSNTDIHLKRLFKVALTSVYLAESVLKYKKQYCKTMTLWNITKLNGDCAV